MVSMRAAAVQWVARLANVGALPSDSAEDRWRKSLLVYVVLLLGVIALTLYTTFYLVLGLRLAAAIPFAFQFMSIVSLLYLARTKDFTTFSNVELFMALTLPVSLQWALGGFAGSGAVILWSAWPAIGQLMFQGPDKSVPWFLAFLGMVVLSAVLDPLFPAFAPALSPTISASFFALNIIVVMSSLYVTLGYFADQRESAMRALNWEHMQLVHEQDRSERLLLSILPKTVAERLKTDPTSTAEAYPEVTVLFVDIVDFTRLSTGLGAEALVAWLNGLFSAFDALCEQHGLEKIKTIGDAYMAVAGVPVPRADHAAAAADLALAIQREVAGRRAPNGEPLHVRIGMHSGPVVAGVIGTSKFIYDLWGDTVNVASRMESHGVPDAIQVTETTQHLLRERYTFSRVRLVDVKGKGPMATCLLIGRAS
jgi:adenylate cyclase